MAPFLRAVQSHFPFLRPLKFATYNLATRFLGLRMDAEFRLLSRMKVDLAVDVGGNWGQSILAFKRVAAPKRIVCFEPSAVLARRLKRIFREDGTVRVENCALSEAAGDYELFTPRYRNYLYDGLASLDYDEAKSWLNSERVAHFDESLLTIEHEVVPVRTLDSQGLDPDVVKIDVQGAELLVVLGGIATLRRNRPLMIVEAPTPELVQLLAGLGLRAYHYDARGLSADWASSTNTVFLSDERRAQMGL